MVQLHFFTGNKNQNFNEEWVLQYLQPNAAFSQTRTNILRDGTQNEFISINNTSKWSNLRFFDQSKVGGSQIKVNPLSR